MQILINLLSFWIGMIVMFLIIKYYMDKEGLHFKDYINNDDEDNQNGGFKL